MLVLDPGDFDNHQSSILFQFVECTFVTSDMEWRIPHVL